MHTSHAYFDGTSQSFDTVLRSVHSGSGCYRANAVNMEETADVAPGNIVTQEELLKGAKAILFAQIG